MKKIILAALLIFAVTASPVLATVMDCGDVAGKSSSQDGKASKTAHVDHHCCHANTLNSVDNNSATIAIDYTANKFAVEQIALRSLHEPSPLLEPPSHV